MSYSDDEELKIGDPELDAEEDLDLGDDLVDPMLDDDLLAEDDEDLEGFAGLDGSAEY